MNIANHILILLGVLFFLVGSAFGQDFVSSDNFNKTIAKNVVVVEFWVEWNQSNQFSELVELNDCEKYRVDIGRFPGLQKEHNVTCIPTVIIFESGEEKDRFKANIMFQLDANKKQVQESIDEIMLAKFN